MKSGAYRIEKISDGVRLYLSSKYQLTGLIGAILALPVRIVLYMFQRYLLKGIREKLEVANG